MSYARPNLTSPTQVNEPEVDGSVSRSVAGAAAARAAMIADQRSHDREVEESTGSMQEHDAQRMIPRARTDNLNMDSGRRLTPNGETIEPPSIYQHRQNRANVNRAIASFTPAQRNSFSGFVNPQNANQERIREMLNGHFESGGSLHDLPRRTQTFARQLDRSIQKAEATNDRMHTVFLPINLAEGTNREEFLDAMRGSRRYSQNLMGYTRANHDLNKIMTDDQDAVYVQLETPRGMYLGGNGATGHILPRGMEIRPVNVSEFEVDDGNGGTRTATVVQMREVPRNDERTVAEQ